MSNPLSSGATRNNRGRTGGRSLHRCRNCLGPGLACTRARAGTLPRRGRARARRAAGHRRRPRQRPQGRPRGGPARSSPPRRVRRFRAACWELTGRGASRTPAPQIKPPLCFSRANADITVSVIDAVLSEMPADPEQLRGVVPLHHEGLRQERALFSTCTVARGGVRKRGGT